MEKLSEKDFQQEVEKLMSKMPENYNAFAVFGKTEPCGKTGCDCSRKITAMGVFQGKPKHIVPLLASISERGRIVSVVLRDAVRFSKVKDTVSEKVDAFLRDFLTKHSEN